MSDFGQPPGGGWGPPPGGAPPPGGGGFSPAPGGAFGPPPQQGGFGQPPGGGFNPAPGGQQQSASGMAIAAIVLACLSFVCGGIFLSIPGAIVAKIEMGKIERGESPKAGEQLAKIGFWISIANIALFAVIICIYMVMFLVAIIANA